MDIEFEKYEATIHFQNDGQRSVTLDDQEIDNPGIISAYYHNSETYFDLEVSGLE